MTAMGENRSLGGDKILLSYSHLIPHRLCGDPLAARSFTKFLVID
jgi:hypothetical protein